MTVTGEATLADSNLTAKAETGSITFEDQLTADGTIADLTAGNDVTIKGETVMTESFFEAEAETGGLTLEKNLTANDSEIDLRAGDTLSMENADLENGSLTADAENDLTFGVIEALENDVTLISQKGNIATDVEDGYIRFRDGADTTKDSNLTFSAGDNTDETKGNIGFEDHVVIIDTDDTVYIQKVNNYYTDFVELVGEEPYQGKRPETDIRTGYDEDGVLSEGDFIKDAAQETIYGERTDVLMSELIDRIVAEQPREEWTAMLDGDALSQLIASGAIKPKDLTAALVDHNPGGAVTAQTIDALLKQGDEVLPGEELSGYEQLGALLAPQLNAPVIGEDGLPTAEYVISDKQIKQYIDQSEKTDGLNLDKVAELAGKTVTEEEIGQMVENAMAKLDYGKYEGTKPEDPAPREAVIEVIEAIGSAYVTNEGSITITQQQGTLTAGAILSDRGDAALNAQGGGIEGNDEEPVNILGKEISLTAANGVGEETKLVTEQRDNRLTLVVNMMKPTADDTLEQGYDDVTTRPLDKDGEVTSEEDKETRPAEGMALETLFDFDWLRVEYAEDATRLNVTAGGDVNIEEKTGDMGLGEIDVTGGDVTLETPGSVLDTRREDQTGNNVQVSGGDAAIEAENGTIGTQDTYITTDVTGTVTAESEYDIFVDDAGDLDLIAQSEKGQVNADAAGRLDVTNIEGDLTVGEMNAGTEANVESVGGVIAGDPIDAPANITAPTISVTAKDGDIAADDDRLTVDTDAANGGTLSADGTNLYIDEISGDLNLEDVDASEDAKISAPEDILDAGGTTLDEAVQAQKDANQTDADADAAQAEAEVKREKADYVKEQLDKAQQAADEAQANTVEGITDAIDTAKAELNTLTPGTEAYEEKQQEIETLEKKLENAIPNEEQLKQTAEEKAEELDAVQVKYDEADKIASDAEEIYEDKRTQADLLQQNADELADQARNEDATVTVGGNLTLDAGGDIGSEDNSLDVQVGGKADLNNPDNIHIAGRGDLHLDGVDLTGKIDVSTTDGTIQNDGVLEGESIDVSSLGGDVGEKEDPLLVRVDQVDAQGENVYIKNLKDTVIGNITAEEDVVLDVEGTVTDTDEQQPSIKAEDLTLNTEGTDGPIDTDVENFHGTGGTIEIDNHSPDLNVTDVDADKLIINTDGDITGENIKVHDIIINAGGNVGTPDDPLTFWADGFVSITAGLRVCNWVNLYEPGSPVNLRSMIVLRFETEIGGQAYNVFAVIGVTRSGHLMLYGYFLYQGEPDEAFWADVFAFLYRTYFVDGVGTLIVDGLDAIKAPAMGRYPDVIIVDVEGYADETALRTARTGALDGLVDDPQAIVLALEAFEAQTAIELQAGFESEEAALEHLNAFGDRYTRDNDLFDPSFLRQMN